MSEILTARSNFLTRRRFIYYSALAAAGTALTSQAKPRPRRVSPNDKLNIAGVGEIMLLGCVAMRTGKKLEWDGPKMRARNAPEASQLVKREYRKGWKL